MSSGVVQVVVATLVCFVCISLRTGYRFFFRCKFHTACHRQWRADDMWMAASVLPLLGRAVCIAWSDSLRDHPGTTAAEIRKSAALASMLLIPGRIFYALFLWMEKLCLLELYLRICDGLPSYRRFGIGIRYVLYLTFVGVVLATLLGCRPLELTWNGNPAGVKCRKARANLITMAACNMATDIVLIIFPISLLRQTGLDLARLIRLALLFALGSLIIITTIVRLPLILRDDAQKTRSLWASIEIACACVVANAPFFYSVFIDMRIGGAHNTSSTTSQRMDRANSGATRLGSDAELYLWHIEQRREAEGEGWDRNVHKGLGEEFITTPFAFDEEDTGLRTNIMLESKRPPR